MNKMKVLAAVVGVAALFAVGAACAKGGAESATAQPPGASAPTTSPQVIAPAPGAPSAPPVAIGAPSAPGVAIGAPAAVPVAPAVRESGMTTAMPVGAPSYAGYPVMQTGSGQSGIWVTGEGVIMMTPDLAILNIGVETTGKNVSEATQKAAKAMDDIVKALKARGLQDRDIQTTYFNIYPQYEYTEVVESGIRRGKQILVGYTVSNSASVKIRDLKNIGEIIDDVAVAGGDATRINGISFTVEDPNPKMTQLREVAVKDALAKAQQFATLTGVTLGKLEFISELSGGAPVIYKDMALRAEAAGASFAPSTPISGGELELRLSVQAVFGIQ